MKIIYYCKKAIRMDLKTMFVWLYLGFLIRIKHIIQTIHSYLEPFFLRKRFLKIIANNSISEEKCLKSALQKIKSTYYFSWEDRNEYLRAFKKKFTIHTEKKIVEDAERVCANIFNFKGSGEKKINQTDWKSDLLTGKTWPSYKSKDIPICVEKGSDILRVWELSRFQWGPTLGKAYWLTNDVKYVKKFETQLSNWRKKNPPGFGPNWVSAQEVALRAINWIISLCFMGGALEISRYEWFNILSNIYFHGLFLEKNLTIRWRGKTRITGNHYLSELLGLLFTGLLFNNTTDGKRWFKYAVSEIEKELEAQVFDDGGHYESSIAGYHRFVLEHFLSAYLIFIKNKIEPADIFLIRLEKMFEFIYGYTRPDGSVPQIGDTDDARVYILSQYSTWHRDKHLYLLEFGYQLFGHKYSDISLDEHKEEAFWLLHQLKRERVISAYNSLVDQKYYKNKSIAFPKTGFYFMKCSGASMAISANYVGLRGKGNHKHNDILSFDLFAHDRAHIVDPGSYMYTGDSKSRNLFRSTSYHNTIMVNGEEINSYDERNLFQMNENANPIVTKWISEDGFDYFEGSHFGYCRLAKPSIHERRIYLNKKLRAWILQDSLHTPNKNENVINKSTSRLSIDINLHFSSSKLEKSIIENSIINLPDSFGQQTFIDIHDINKKKFPTVFVKNNKNNICLAIQILKCTESLDIEIQNGWISPSYGIKYSAPILNLSGFCNIPFHVVYLITTIQ